MNSLFPEFRPHPLIRGGHLQTIGSVLLPSRRLRYTATQRIVSLPDGDQLVLHDDCPANWSAGGRVALLIHGLCGSHRSSYMQRTSARLTARGVRAVRLDLRGCGAGFELARWPYHSGRSEDAAAAIEAIAALCPDSPLTVIGYSLGGNIALKLVGELGDRVCGGLDSCIAVCPPIDLACCARNITRRSNHAYNRFFVRTLTRTVAARGRLRPDVPGLPPGRRPRTLPEFDDLYTAPVSGFGTAENYYRRASSLPLLAAVRRPTRIIAADDDPMIPCEMFRDLPASDYVWLHITRGGGHLGFVGLSGCDADRRWLDWRVVDWTLAFDQRADFAPSSDSPSSATHRSSAPQPSSDTSRSHALSGNSVRMISRLQPGS